MGELINFPSFAAGELAPELYGRVDQASYYIGARSLLNFYVEKYGGISNRPGTKFTAVSKDSTKKSRKIPFQFNEEQTYALEFGDLYMRVIRNGAEVTETAQNITGATQANPVVLTINSHGYSNNDDIYVADVAGMTELNGRTFRVANVTTHTVELTDLLGSNIDGTGYGAYSSGGTGARIYTVTTPWTEDDLFDLTYTQSNDVLTVFHSDYSTRDITRTAHNSWTISQFDNSEGPFKSVNTTTTTLTCSHASGTGRTLTASASLFTSDMVGDFIYIEQEPNDTTARWEPGKVIGSTGLVRRAGAHYYESGTTATTGTVKPEHVEGTEMDGDAGVRWDYLHSGFGIVKITAYSSATSVTVDVVKRLPDLVVSGTTTIWALAAWSTTEGYPAAGCYHKQRLCTGGTTQQPNGIWLSGVGLRTYFGKSNPILDDEAITALLDTTQVNAIRHLLPLKQLIVLTSASEQLINGPDDLLLATDPPTAEVQGYTGSNKVSPIIIGNTALFVEDAGNVVRSLAYSFESDSFSGIDVSARSPHLFRGKSIVDWGFQRYPTGIVWTVMSDGGLNGLTFMPEQQVYAWHRHSMGDSVESVCCIREGDETAVYFNVKRTINGNTVRYCERMASRNFDTIRDAYFVDCGLSYDGRNYTEDSSGNLTASTAITMTLSGGTDWDETETLTLTASAASFASTDVDDAIFIWYKDSDDIAHKLELTITGYTSTTVVSVVPSLEVPTDAVINGSTVNLRTTATLFWEFARNEFTPLYHLEGESVSVLADGAEVPDLSVSSGTVTLSEPAAVVHIGIGYTAQFESLDIAGSGGRPGVLKGRTITIPRLLITTRDTVGVFAGANGFSKLTELKQRTPSLGYDAPIPAETAVFELTTSHTYGRELRMYAQQTKPLPISITCITPEVQSGQ